MKALIFKTSDCGYRDVREIESLDDLAELGTEHPLVVDFNSLWGCGYDIVVEIYDDYRE